MEPKTIFCDIDGCILEHGVTGVSDCWSYYDEDSDLKPITLPGVKEKFDEWCTNHFRVILVTGRPECMRQDTIYRLQMIKGVWWNQLVMDVGHGPRYLINDMKENDTKLSAFAINIKRNAGLKDVEV